MNVPDALSTLSSGAAIAGHVLNAKEKMQQYSRLKEEVEDAKVYISTVKNYINEGVKSRINACSLPALVDAVRAYQHFFKINFLGQANASFMVAYPEWFRMELQSALAGVHHGADKFRMEMQSYSDSVHETLLSSDPASKPKDVLALIRSELRKKNSECARVAEFFKARNSPKPQWDNCPECGRRSEQKTPSERFKSDSREVKTN